MWIKASVKPQEHFCGHQLCTRLSGSRQIKIQRFLAKDRFSGRRRRHGLIQVRSGGARDDDAGDGGIAKYRVHIRNRGTRLPGERLGGFGIWIDDIFQRQFRRTSRIAGMNLSDPTGPN